VNISAIRLKDLVEEKFQEGIIDLEGTGHCANYEWKFTWTSYGGNRPEMRVDAGGLTGVDVVTTVKTVEDGGLFLDPIPGEFLRIPAAKPQVSGLHRTILHNNSSPSSPIAPSFRSLGSSLRFLAIRPFRQFRFIFFILFSQVVVFVNEILGSCRHGNNCTFEYSAEKTPNLTSISPSTGPGGTVITILGSGFSTVNEENSVQIGGITCVVLSSTSDNITCRAGKRF